MRVTDPLALTIRRIIGIPASLLAGGEAANIVDQVSLIRLPRDFPLHRSYTRSTRAA